MRSFIFLIASLTYIVGYAQVPHYHPVPVVVGSQAPYVEHKQGYIKSLKDVKSLNIIYEYSTMRVSKYHNEKEYLDAKTSAYGDDRERAERFLKRWNEAPAELYEPKFEELFNKHMKERIVAKNGGTSDITLKVKTLFIEPGFNVFVVKQNAYVTVECTFLDKEGGVILRYFIEYATGRSGSYSDFDACSRIAEGYAKAAKMLAKELYRGLKRLK